jgi:transcriptional regulator
MYTQKHFEVTKRDELLAFIKANAFGQLITKVEGRLFSTHIPFLLLGNGKSLVCHLAKGNPQWSNIEEQELLITFQGPHDYISPSWYGSPGVPTWNYQVVHVYGRAKLISGTEELRRIVNEMTNEYEFTFEKPWKPEYKESLLQAIVGVEIEITEIQGKYKLSQNRPESDRRQVIEKLELSGSLSLSEAMKNES